MWRNSNVRYIMLSISKDIQVEYVQHSSQSSYNSNQNEEAVSALQSQMARVRYLGITNYRPRIDLGL